jgi:phosphatidylethanolamine-binding protein (PEBP) family uncharacterized protein
VRPDPYADLPAVPAFEVSSGIVADGATMPVAQRSGIFGAGGQDVSPDLTWTGFPAPTRSFVVTRYDPDAPTPSGFWHWAVVDLPSDITLLPVGAGESDDALPAGRHITNAARPGPLPARGGSGLGTSLQASVTRVARRNTVAASWA